MKSVLKLMRAHIRHGKDAFFGIVLLMMLLTFSFSGTVSNDDALRAALEENFVEADVGDIMVVINDDQLTDEMLEALDSDSMVERYSVRDSLWLRSKPEIDGNEEELGLEFRRRSDDIDVFNDSSDGFTEDNGLNKGEIFLPYKLKMNKKLKPGTVISFTTSRGTEESYTVKGFYEDKVFGATTISTNYCILSEEDYDRLAGEETDGSSGLMRLLIRQYEIHIHGTEGTDITALNRHLTENSPLVRASSATITRQHIMECFEMYSNTGTRGVAVFTIILLAVILITMHNSISASVEMEYTDLGILRSLGFSAGRIRLVYVAEYVLALLIGSTLGILVSIPVCAVLIRLWMNMTCILTDTQVSVLKCAALALGMIAVCIGFIFAATAKISRISPVRAISGGRDEVHFDSRLNCRIRKHPLSLSLVLRQLNAHRRSYAGTAFIVVILVYFLVSITLLTANLDPGKLFTTANGEVNLLNTGGLSMDNADKVEEAVREIDSEASLYTQSYHRMAVNGEFVPVQCFRREEDQYDLLEGRQPKYDNEILVTKNLADDLGKGIGDTVTVSYQDSSEEYIITGYFQTVFEFGLISMMTPEGIKKLGFNDIQVAQIKLGDTSKTQEVIDMLNSRFGDLLSASEYKEKETMMTYRRIVTVLMDSSIYTIYSVILIFAAVVVVMLCRRTFIRERTDIGIFKALGSSVGSLRMQFALRFAAVALIGSVLGGTLSALWAKRMMAFMLKIVGLTDFNAELSPLDFALPAAAVCLCFFVCAYAVSGKIKRVDVRELITE